MKIEHLIVGELETNCYLLVSKDELGIIDPGGEAEKILKEIEKVKAKPSRGLGLASPKRILSKFFYWAEPKYIINTHCHFDHILANEKIRKETGVEILIHQAEKDFINFKIDRFLKEGDKIKIGESVLSVIHTPGHTKGSICLLGKNFIFTGDTLFKDGYGRTDFPEGSQKDIEESLEKLAKLLKPGMTVYPGHGEIFKHT